MKDWTGFPESCPRINQPQTELRRETDQHRTEKTAPLTNPGVYGQYNQLQQPSQIFLFVFFVTVSSLILDTLGFLIFVSMHLKHVNMFFFFFLSAPLCAVGLHNRPFCPLMCLQTFICSDSEGLLRVVSFCEDKLVCECGACLKRRELCLFALLSHMSVIYSLIIKSFFLPKLLLCLYAFH